MLCAKQQEKYSIGRHDPQSGGVQSISKCRIEKSADLGGLFFGPKLCFVSSLPIEGIWRVCGALTWRKCVSRVSVGDGLLIILCPYAIQPCVAAPKWRAPCVAKVSVL